MSTRLGFLTPQQQEAAGVFVLTQAEARRHEAQFKAIRQVQDAKQRDELRDRLFEKIKEERRANLQAQQTQARAASETTAKSKGVQAATKFETDKQEFARGESELDPKTGGKIFRRTVEDTIGTSEGFGSFGGGVKGGSKTIKVEVSDVVGTSEPTTPGREEPKEPKKIPQFLIEKTDFFAEVGSQDVKAIHTFKQFDKTETSQFSNLFLESKQPKKKFIPGQEFVIVGRETAAAFTPLDIAPSPLTRFFPSSEFAEKERQFKEAHIKPLRGLVEPEDKSLLTSNIESLTGGKGFTTTGRGTLADIESATAEFLLLAAPTRKLELLGKVTRPPIEVAPRPGLKAEFIIKSTRGTEKAKTFEQAQTTVSKLTGEGAKDIKVTAVQKPFTQVRIFDKPVITSIAGQGVSFGTGKALLKPATVKELSPTGRGLELTTLKPTQRELLTSPEGADVLAKAGKVTPEQAKVIPKFKEVAEALDFAERKIKRKDLVLQKDLSAALETPAEQRALVERIRPSFKQPVKGSEVLKTTVKPDLEIKDIDADFFKKSDTALKKAEFGQSALTESMVGKRGAVREGTKVFVGELSGKFEKGKPSEFFHGTDIQSAQSILKKQGFEFSLAGKQTARFLEKEITDPDIQRLTPKGTAFLRETGEGTKRFRKSAALKTGLSPAVLKVELKEAAKIKKISRADPKKVHLSEDIEKAKAEGFQGIVRNMGTKGTKDELILFTNKPIKRISLAQQELIKKEKLLEFLTEKDVIDTAASSAADTSRIMGKPALRRIEKVKTPEGRTAREISLESQAKRMLADFGSIQSPRTEKAQTDISELVSGARLAETPEGFRLGSPEFRTKTPARLPITLEQVAKDLREQKPRGFEQRAETLESFAKEIRTTFKEVDFVEVGKKPKPSLQDDLIEFTDEKPFTKSRAAIQELKQSVPALAPSSVVRGSAIKPSVSKSITSPISKGSISRGSTTSPIQKSVPSRASKISPIQSRPSILKPSKPSPVSRISPGSVLSPPSPTSPGSPASKITGRGSRGSSLLRTRPPTLIPDRPVKAAALIFFKSAKKPPDPDPTKPRREFIGNVPINKLVGAFNRFDIKRRGIKKAIKFDKKAQREKNRSIIGETKSLARSLKDIKL